MNPAEKENIQNSFKKIKEEMLSLNDQILFLKKQLSQTNKSLNYLNSYLLKSISESKSESKTQSSTSTTDSQQTSQNPAHNLHYNKELSPNSHISIGNEGVPADRQQTVDRQIMPEKLEESEEPIVFSLPSLTSEKKIMPDDKGNTENHIPNVSTIKDISLILNELKKELKSKFKNLTNQELLIFSLIYTLNEEKGEVSYKDISLKANLTESSVRDYISRLEHKGIPLIKEKKNNKMIILKIPDELKHISTLDSLAKLSKN